MIEAMMNEQLRLPELSNIKFYNKLQVAITGPFDSSQPKAGINARYWQQVVGSRRANDSDYPWSEPKLEEACERPFVNMAPLFPDSEPVILHRINYATVRHAPRTDATAPKPRTRSLISTEGLRVRAGAVARPVSRWLRG